MHINSTCIEIPIWNEQIYIAVIIILCVCVCYRSFLSTMEVLRRKGESVVTQYNGIVSQSKMKVERERANYAMIGSFLMLTSCFYAFALCMFMWALSSVVIEPVKYTHLTSSICSRATVQDAHSKIIIRRRELAVMDFNIIENVFILVGHRQTIINILLNKRNEMKFDYQNCSCSLTKSHHFGVLHGCASLINK